MAIIDSVRTKLARDLDQYFTDYTMEHKGELTQELMNKLGAEYMKENRARYIKNALAISWWKWYLAASQPVPNGFTFLRTKQMRAMDRETLVISADIPRNNTILFSVDKWISLGFSFTPCDELERVAHQRINTLTNMNTMIDGSPYTPMRFDSGSCFDIKLKDNINDMELGTAIKKGKYKAFTDGYWVILEPGRLSPGRHVINSNASCSMGILYLGVEYHVNIK